MNLNYKLIFLFFIFFISNISLANDQIAYVDMEIIMNNSKVGKSFTEKLNESQKLNINFFKKKEDALRNKEKKIISQQNILEKTEFEKQLKELQLEVNEYRKEKNKRINELNKKKLDATQILLKNITPILSQYAKDNSISILIQKKNIVIGKTNLDKTNDILKIVDKKIKKINFN